MNAAPTRAMCIEENMGLVHSCAHRLQGRGMEYDDLVQAGCLGLLKAADGFDANRGFAFATYAVPLILGEMRQLFRVGGNVKVGRTTKDRARDLLRLQSELQNELQREPSIRELAARAGMEPSEAAVLLGAVLPPLSLTATNEAGQPEFDVPVEAPEARLTDSLALRQVLDGLPPEDRRLMECRYFRSMTQSQTATLLGLTQVQVSRREKKLLLQMRGCLG